MESTSPRRRGCRGYICQAQDASWSSSHKRTNELQEIIRRVKKFLQVCLVSDQFLTMIGSVSYEVALFLFQKKNDLITSENESGLAGLSMSSTQMYNSSERPCVKSLLQTTLMRCRNTEFSTKYSKIWH